MPKMTPRQIDKRVIAGRKALAAWAERNGDIEQAQILAELGALEALMATAPHEKRDKIKTLIARYRRVSQGKP